MKVGFAGLTHLGLVYSLTTAAKGFTTVAFDADSKLIAFLEQGAFPVNEPDMIGLWKAHRDQINYTDQIKNLQDCSLVFISLDISTDDNHQSNLVPLHALIDSVIIALDSGTTLVLLNQVPPGFTREISLHHASIITVKNLAVYYQVETLIFGRAMQRALLPERYIVGAQNPSAAFPKAYQTWLDVFDCPVLKMRLESAELAKTAINLFLVSTVTTTNLLAELCEVLGANWSEIIPALQMDRRIGPHAYLQPGLGISGGNLPRDLVTLQGLAQQHHTHAELIETWIRDSDYRRDWVTRKIKEIVLTQNTQPKLAVWGLAYIANTAFIKNSAGVALLRTHSLYASAAFDPAVKSLPESFTKTELTPNALEALRDSDVLCVMTPWQEFRQISPVVIANHLRGRIILDPLGTLDGPACIAAGLSYFRMGFSNI